MAIGDEEVRERVVKELWCEMQCYACAGTGKKHEWKMEPCVYPAAKSSSVTVAMRGVSTLSPTNEPCPTCDGKGSRMAYIEDVYE